MARKPRPGWWETRGAYGCWINGVQHTLAKGEKDEPAGPTFKAAQQELWRLLEEANIASAGGVNKIRLLVEAYLTWVEEHRRPKTLETKRFALTPFVKMFGEESVRSLNSDKVKEFVAAMQDPARQGTNRRPWKAGTVSVFMESIHSALNFAVGQKWIHDNPLGRLRMPAFKTRARERIVEPAEHQTVLKALAPARNRFVRRFVVALENTGARPGELAAATVRDWNDSLGAIVYFGDDKRREDEFAHKTSGKGQDRFIYFTGEALEMMREWVKGKPGKTPLFPTRRGLHYRPNDVSAILRRLREKVGLSHLVPYAYRHTLATRWLEAGKPIAQLAEILGNTPATILKHYSHLCRSHGVLRAALEDLKRSNV
jgi:integrase